MIEGLYTFKELIDKFQLRDPEYNMTKDAQIKWIAARGIFIEAIKKDKQSWLFKVLNDVDNTYTQQQIIKKYNLTEDENKVIPNFLDFAEKRGILLERYSFCKRPYYYKIIDDKIATYEWFPHPQYPYFEVCKEGLVRHTIKKNIYKGSNAYDYIQIMDSKTGNFYLAHRLIMETFNPIENMKEKYVDHINGIRTDNRLENLRWVTPQENMIFRKENWDLLQENFNKLLKQVGYEKMNEILKEQLKKL